MYRRLLFIVCGIWLLQSCYYDKGCLFLPQSVTCHYSYSDISRMQYKTTLGHTNEEKRWLDLELCGGVREEYWVKVLNKKVEEEPEKFRDAFKKLLVFNNEDINQYFHPMNYIRQVSLCMKKKGYVIFSSADCYENNLCK